MDTDKILDAASKLAAKAKPGILKIDDKVYTFVFDPSNWVYLVYEYMVYLLSYNTKSLATAKKWLREYLAN